MFWWEKTLATRNKSAIKNENIWNKELHSSFIDNIWGADLDDMQLTSKFDKGFRFLLCVMKIYSKYGWVIPLKDKKRYYNY